MKKETESSAVQNKAAEGEKGAKRIIRRGRKPSAKAERETKETVEKPKRTRTVPMRLSIRSMRHIMELQCQ